MKKAWIVLSGGEAAYVSQLPGLSLEKGEEGK